MAQSRRGAQVEPRRVRIGHQRGRHGAPETQLQAHFEIAVKGEVHSHEAGKFVLPPQPPRTKTDVRRGDIGRVVPLH